MRATESAVAASGWAPASEADLSRRRPGATSVKIVADHRGRGAKCKTGKFTKWSLGKKKATKEKICCYKCKLCYSKSIAVSTPNPALSSDAQTHKSLQEKLKKNQSLIFLKTSQSPTPPTSSFEFSKKKWPEKRRKVIYSPDSGAEELC